MCQQKCSDDTQRNIYLHRLEENISKRKKVEEVPAAFEREYKMVQDKIQKLTDELVSIQKRIRIEENKVKQLNENNVNNPNRYTLDGISRFLGKIEYASDTIATLEADGELMAEIESLRARIAELRKIADESVIKRKIENAITKISVKQMDLLKLLDAERPNDPFRLDYKNLTVEVDGEDGRKDYLWEIGSGSNWLAYHISTILGLQEFFATFQSSVPNFVVFDQPSQVYFPHDSIDDKKINDMDRNAVKSIFITMAKSVSNVHNNMQILVLEHADDSIYGDVQGVNEVCVWRNGEKLIPLEWIEE